MQILMRFITSIILNLVLFANADELHRLGKPQNVTSAKPNSGIVYKPIVATTQQKPNASAKPHSIALSKFYDEDGNEFDYNTMSVRFNPCVRGISSKVCVIDSKVTELDEHLTSCCDEINTNVDSCCEQLGSKLTVIENKIDNLNPGVVSCCDNIENVVASCCADIENAVASCCEATDASIDSCCSQIESHLEVIETKINNLNPGAITSCCAHIENIVASCCADIENAVASCCAATDVAIASCCEATDVSIDSCCSQIESHLEVIETKINNLSPASILSCCDKIESLIGGIDTDLASCCDGINSKMDAACGATAIHQVDIPYTITEPGHYCVAENLQGTSPIITIAASDVHLDLNGYELRAATDDSGIVIDTSNQRQSIVIRNGFIIGSILYQLCHAGVYVNPGSVVLDLTIEDLSINGFYQAGIQLGNHGGLFIKNCNIFANSLLGITNHLCSGPDTGTPGFLSDGHIEHCTIVSNGDGALLGNFNGLTILSSNFNENDGSGLKLNTDGKVPTPGENLVIVDSAFNKNRALGGGSISGAYILTTNNFVIKNSEFNNNESDGLRLGEPPLSLVSQGCSNGRIENCIGNNNTGSGMFIDFSDAITIIDSQACQSARNAGDAGFKFNSSTNVTIENCTSFENQEGFLVAGGLTFLFKNSSALSNTAEGFDVGASACFIGCVAKENGLAYGSEASGFFLADGPGIVKECIAVGNGFYGFAEPDFVVTPNFQYYANEACNNGIVGNYSPNIENSDHAPVTSPANARGVDNVDCARSDVDQIDILQSCCEAINSKIDAACGATAIHQVDIPYTITEPGHYCVAENLAGTTGGIITILTSDVTLDLNGYELQAATDISAIVVAASSNLSGIVIRNGFLVGDPYVAALDSGVNFIGTSTIRDVTLDALSIRNFSQGIDFNAFIKDLTLKNSTLYENGFGINTESGLALNNIVIENSQLNNNINGNYFENASDITVLNSSFDNARASSGITFVNGTRIKCSYCSFNNSLGGIGMDSRDQAIADIVIEHCSCDNNQFVGFRCFSDAFITPLPAQNIRISDSTFNNNALIPGAFGSIQIERAEGITIERCTINDNTNVSGIYIDTGNAIKIVDCQANNNGSSILNAGYRFLNCADAIIENCAAVENSKGFIVQSGINFLFKNTSALSNTAEGFDVGDSICFIGCIAKENGLAYGSEASGFLLADGPGIVKECIAVGNGLYGFEEPGFVVTPNFQYYANEACNNGSVGNYSPNIETGDHAPVTSPANARGVDNVDCARSDVDQIDILQSCCEQINSKLDAACGATAIHQVDLIPGVGYLITEPGHYCVAENLQGTSPIITISASDVYLDLNGYELQAATDDSAIIIDATAPHSGIVIRNGFLVGDTYVGGADAGINFIGAYTIKDVTLSSLSIRNFSQGIYFNAFIKNLTLKDSTLFENDLGITTELNIALNNIVIENCQFNNNTADIRNASDVTVLNTSFDNVLGSSGVQLSQSTRINFSECSFNNNSIGLFMTKADRCEITDCSALSNRNAGFELIDSSYNCLKNCKAVSTGAANNAYGFISSAGTGNIFDNCAANDTRTIRSTVDFLAAGFVLTATETRSKIINSNACNTTTPTVGLAKAYGILLQQEFSGTYTETIKKTTMGGVPIGQIKSVDWSPDNKYLAALDSAASQVNIYQFNGSVLMETASLSIGAVSNKVRWSNNGKFVIVVSNADSFEIYPFFNGIVDTPDIVIVDNGDVTQNIVSVAWSYDDQYFAVGSESTLPGAFGGFVRVYKFDGGTATQVALITLPTGAASAIRSVDWHPFAYKVVTAGTADSGGDTVVVYNFTGSSLVKLDGDTTGSTDNAVDWDPSGKYIAVGSSNVGPGELSIFSWNDTTNVLAPVTSAATEDLFSVHWGNDDKFILVAGTGALDAFIATYRFNSTTSTLTLAKSSTIPDSSTSPDARWTPSENYFAAGSDSSTGVLRIFQSLITGVDRCLVKNNNVTNTNGGCHTSVGINAYSNQNFVQQNTAFDNDINYLFVSNIYTDGMFGEPTGIQNISVPPL